MSKVIIIYYTRTGITKKMAEIIHKEIKNNNIEADIFPVESVKPKQLLDYDGIIIGSPTYYGTLAGPIKQFLDDSVALHGKFNGKIGMAFSSSANIAGGNETTILSILQALLIHGMIIQGDFKGDHYGPVAVGNIDKRCEDNCRRMALRFIDLVRKLA